MTNLTESSTYETGIFQIETNTPVQGGSGGPANTQAQQLANRTKYLKDHVDSIESGTTLASTIHASTNKTTLVDADEIPITNSASSFALGRSVLSNLWNYIKTKTDQLYITSTFTDLTTTISSSSGVVSIDLSSAYRRYEITLTENITSWTFTNYPASGSLKEIYITVIQHASAVKTVVSPATAGRTAGGIPWVASTVLSSREMLVLNCFNDSTRTLFPTGVQA